MKIECRELRIPTPWGHIAAKSWGHETNYPVICIHGTLDNAGSFDTLMPLLPVSFYYICIDLPGHGMSSHFEKSQPIFFENFILPVKIVCDFLKRETYILMGHSLGAICCYIFSQLYPQVVSKLVLIDALYLEPQSPEQYIKNLATAHDILRKTLTFKQEEKPLMSYDTVVKKVMESRSHGGMLTSEAAEQIARRMVTKINDNQYRFAYDYRLRKVLFPPMDIKYIIKLIKIRPVECSILILITEETESTVYMNYMHEVLKLFTDVEKHSIKFIKGGHHHSHHTNPELFADTISMFLTKDTSKL